MKAIICTKYGPPEVLKVAEVPKPVLTKNKVLIRVRATSVNSGDVRIRALRVGTGIGGAITKCIMRCIVGFTGPRRKILGMVLAGEVVEVGDAASAFRVGDRVYAMTGLQFGAFAEYAAVRENRAIAHMPQTASFEDAAALPFGGTTALYFLRKAGIERAQTVLIYGSSGAVGTAAVQVAKYFGAQVTAVCGADGVELARHLGADAVYDYTQTPLKDIIGQFDIVFDAVGKITKADAAHLLRPQAPYITVGGLDVAKETASDLKKLAQMFDEGAFRSTIDRVYDLDHMVEAHHYVDSGRKKGNVIVTI